MQLKTVGKLLRPFPYEPLNTELIIGLYFDSRIVVRSIRTYISTCFMVNLFELDLVDSVLDLLFCLLKPEMFIE